MKKISSLIFLVSITVFSQNHLLEKKFDSILSSYTNSNKPGLAGGVLQNGKILYLKGFGVEDVETNKLITSKTKFQVGDLAKQFTVLSLLLLEKEGKLSLEDNVRKHIPILPKYQYPLKVKHLLNHSSGLHVLYPLKELLNVRQDDLFTHDDALRIISLQQKLNFKPGTQFSYHSSNTEIILMVEIIKSISKQSFEDFTKKHVFESLEMRNTSFNTPRGMLKNLAKSYSIGNDIRYNPVNDLTLGISNLYTTAEDFSKWFQLYSGNHKLSSLINKLDKYVTLDSGKEYASTWGKVTLGRYFDHPERGLKKMSWQYGLIGGYGANVFRFQSHNVIAFVLGNNNRYNGMPAGSMANQILEKEFTEPAEIDYSKIKVKSLSKKEMKKFEGFYWDRTNSLVREIYLKNDTLRYKRLNGNAETPLLALTKNKFQFYLQGDTEVIIRFNKNNFKLSSLNSDESTYDKISLINSTDVNLKEYVGDYYNKELGVVLNFTLKKDSLVVSNFKTEPIQFYPIVKDAFRSNTYIYSGIQFTRNNKIVNGFNINTDGVKNLFFRKITSI